jgi:hypothetical protein
MYRSGRMPPGTRGRRTVGVVVVVHDCVDPHAGRSRAVTVRALPVQPRPTLRKTEAGMAPPALMSNGDEHLVPETLLGHKTHPFPYRGL